jgi:hypothetical protein
MKDVTVRIRGIYSTALTKILAARGYGICQVSRLIQKRLGIESLDRPPDIDIRHTYNRQGISIVANGAVLGEFLEDMKEDFSDIFVIPSGIDLYGIYKGKNMGRGEIDLGGFTGYLEDRTTERELLVQVSEIRNRPILTTRISYSGDYAILIPQEGVKISRKVEDSEERRRLFQIANQLQVSPGYGLLWRTAATGCEQGPLENEVRKLVEDMHRIQMEFPSARTSLLREGKKHVNILFGGESKRRMDFIRHNVLPTAHNHHKLKSSGKDVSLAVDVFELLLEKYSVEENLDEMLWDLNPWSPGNVVLLEHIRANGEKVHLGRAVIQEFRYPCVSMERKMHTYGVYDGLNTKKEKGDRVITDMKEGEWVFVHSYYSSNGKLKGRYYNVCTPVEFYPYKIRYLDLEVDVVEEEGRPKKIIDTEKLEKRVEEGYISNRLRKKALEVAQEVMERTIWIR